MTVGGGAWGRGPLVPIGCGHLFLAMLLNAGCAKGPAIVPGLATLEVDWQPFRWVNATVGAVTVERASILVDATDPAMVIGQPKDTGPGAIPMQLDFGFASTGAFGLPLRLLEPIATDSVRARRVLDGTVARLGRREDSVGVGRPYRLGTLGLLFFGIKGLLIDQVEQRLGAPRPRTMLPAAITDRMQWSEAREEGGRLRIPLVRESVRLGDLAMDPGSSLVPLQLNHEVWRRLTARIGDESENVRLVFPASSDSLVLIGARPTIPLTLGTIALGDGLVFYPASGPPEFVHPRLGEGVVGVVGNQLFTPFRLIYVNVRAKRLGVVR